MLPFRATALLLSATLLGCASEPPQFGHFRSPPSGMAMVVLYRVEEASGRSARMIPAVNVNGRLSWPLTPGKYLQEVVAPGKVTLVIERQQFESGTVDWRATTDASVEVMANPNETYYVELNLRFRSFSFQQSDVVTAVNAVRGQRAGN